MPHAPSRLRSDSEEGRSTDHPPEIASRDSARVPGRGHAVSVQSWLAPLEADLLAEPQTGPQLDDLVLSQGALGTGVEVDLNHGLTGRQSAEFPNLRSEEHTPEIQSR